jgi:hypothetical protein
MGQFDVIDDDDEIGETTDWYPGTVTEFHDDINGEGKLHHFTVEYDDGDTVATEAIIGDHEVQIVSLPDTDGQHISTVRRSFRILKRSNRSVYGGD